MALNSFGTSGTSYSPGGVRQRSFAPLTGGARPPVVAPPRPPAPTIVAKPPQMSAAGQARVNAFNAIGGGVGQSSPDSNGGIDAMAAMINSQVGGGGQLIPGMSGSGQGGGAQSLGSFQFDGTSGGGQQGGYQQQNSWMPNQQQVNQATGGWISNPEQRWAQQPGALPYGPGMSAGENKFNLLQYLTQQGPSAQQYAEGLPNTANLYQQNLGGAQGAIGGGFGSAYQGPQGNPYFPPAGGGGPQAPNIQGAPTNYNYQNQSAPGFQAPQFGQAQMRQFDPNSVQGPGFTPRQGFDPNSVQGPNVGQISTPQNNFSGPQSGVPGFQDIVNQSRQMGGSGAPGAVPRENIQGSGFQQSQLFGNPNSIANQGFQSALGAAQGQAGAGLNQDIFKQQSAALQRELGAAGLAANVNAAEEVGGRGILYNPQASGVSDEAFAKYYAPAQAQIGSKLADLAAGNLDRTIQQQQFGTSALTGLGGAASNAAQGNAGLLQGDSQFLGGAQLQQRGQDIGQNQFGAQFGADNQARNLQALTGLAGTLGGLQNEAFGLGTTRGLGVGEQDLRAQQLNQQGLLDAYGLQTGRAGTYGNLANQNQQLNQQGLIDAYNAQTNRIGQQGDIFNQGVSNFNNAFQNETQRGQVGANARADYNNLGFNYANMNTNAGLDYARLGAGNQNAYNQQLIDLYNAQGNQFNQGQQNQQGWADLYQRGQIEAGNQGLNQGRFGLDFLNSMANNQNINNNLLAGANSQDVGNFWNQWGNLYNQAQAAQINRENNRFNPGQAITNLAGGFLSSGGLFGGGGQPQAQQYGGYQGIPRQQLQYGGF